MRKPRTTIEATIRASVEELLRTHPDITDEAFGAAIGRGYAWVRAFRTGVRHAMDVELLVAIADYFQVSVGYLLGEPGVKQDAALAEVLAAWPTLTPRQRKLVATVVQSYAAQDE